MPTLDRVQGGERDEDWSVRATEITGHGVHRTIAGGSGERGLGGGKRQRLFSWLLASRYELEMTHKEPLPSLQGRLGGFVVARP